MSQILTTPTCSVSPAGGGTCSYTTLGSDSSTTILPEDKKTDKGWQDYRYSAVPAQGYHFVKFEVTVRMLPDDYELVYDKQGTWDAQLQAYIYETDGSSGDEYIQDGAAWWMEAYDWNHRTQSWDFWYTKYAGSIDVVAVFEPDGPTPEGPYLIYDDSSGQLIYDDVNTGRLVYGGVL